MKFGIRGKIALLVIIAAATSAYLVATLLSQKAADLLRQHEIVDLGDEATLRGWELVDQIDGLREDITNLSFSMQLQRRLIQASDDEEAIQQIVQKLARRYWDRHLRIDLVPFEDGKWLAPKILDQKATISKSAEWLPDPTEVDDRRVYLSPIMRREVTRENHGAAENVMREEAVVWALAPLGNPIAPGPDDESVKRPSRFIRIMMTLSDTPSPRHLMALLPDTGGLLLMKPEEDVPGKDGNDEVFRKVAALPVVREYFEEHNREPEAVAVEEARDEDPRVERFHREERLPINNPYFFIEATPNARLAAAINNTEKEKFDAFFVRLRHRCQSKGRIGGLRNAVNVLRLLSVSREKMDELRTIVTEELKIEYPDAFDGLNWRGKPVLCDDINLWTVRLSFGTKDEPLDYLLIYSVLEDEMSSSIQHEMKFLRNLAFLIAAGAGIVAFIISIFFIRPLQQMTETAQQVIEADPDQFHVNLAALASQLPIRRRDEVGDIARASKRLFEEVIDFHGELEQRVDDRTRKLHKANFELEEAYEKLMSLHHEKDAFVAKVSHDLRQPLTVIFMQIDDLLMSDLDDDQRKGLEKIQGQAKRELDLVNDILDYQKIIMGADPLQREEIDVCSLMNGLEEAHAGTARAKSLVFTQICDPGIGSLTADHKRVQQVLNNLVGNAVKFTKEGSVEIVALQREISDEEWIEFSVNDTGRGMSPGEQEKAFTPFESTRKDNPGGNGLGLSIAKELVEQMGGQIGFISEHGVGTRFTVMLPRKATAPAYDRKIEDATPASSRLPVRKKSRVSSTDIDSLPVASEDDYTGPIPPGSTVLIIDDDPAVRELLERLLQNEGYAVLSAENGDEGIKMAREKKPDAITLDVVMPEKDGWKVLSDLKSDPETENIPVVMVSIMAKNAQGLALGVEDFLVKPIDSNRLSRVMRRITSQSMQRNILIVDDDPDSREILGKIIGDQGWQPVLAGDGTEALEILQKTRPAAIVLDLLMAGMDGFEFLSRIEDDEGLKSIPVIVVTGKNTTADESDFLNEQQVANIIMKGETTAKEVIATIKRKVKGKPGK